MKTLILLMMLLAPKSQDKDLEVAKWCFERFGYNLEVMERILDDIDNYRPDLKSNRIAIEYFRLAKIAA